MVTGQFILLIILSDLNKNRDNSNNNSTTANNNTKITEYGRVIR